MLWWEEERETSIKKDYSFLHSKDYNDNDNDKDNLKVAYAAEGLDTPGIMAHSTRRTATSWTVINGATFESVMRAADWRTRSTFAKHYAFDLWKQKDQGFGRAVLEGPSK